MKVTTTNYSLFIGGILMVAPSMMTTGVSAWGWGSVARKLSNGVIEEEVIATVVNSNTIESIIHQEKRFVLFNSRRLTGECLPICTDQPPSPMEPRPPTPAETAFPPISFGLENQPLSSDFPSLGETSSSSPETSSGETSSFSPETSSGETHTRVSCSMDSPCEYTILGPSFCNFDFTLHGENGGFCEDCVDVPDCENDGLPPLGVVDCKRVCIMFRDTWRPVTDFPTSDYPSMGDTSRYPETGSPTSDYPSMGDTSRYPETGSPTSDYPSMGDTSRYPETGSPTSDYPSMGDTSRYPETGSPTSDYPSMGDTSRYPGTGFPTSDFPSFGETGSSEADLDPTTFCHDLAVNNACDLSGPGSCQINPGPNNEPSCGRGVPEGYYPDLTNCNAYCKCTGTTAPSRYEIVNTGLEWDNFQQGFETNFYFQGPYAMFGEGGAWGTNGGGAGRPSDMSLEGRKRPPYCGPKQVCPPGSYASQPWNNCEQFFTCNNGQSGPVFDCPPGTLFDANISMCNMAASVQCGENED